MWRGGAILAVMMSSLVAFAAPENATIPWSLKVEDTIAQARITRQPLMFWVMGRSASRDDRVENRQKLAFGDPLVVELASRFLPIKLSRSRYREQLKKWDLSPKANLEIVFVTPDGDKIDTLAPLGVCEPEILSRKMALVYQHYRRGMFAKEIKPVLEDEQSTGSELEDALKRIEQFLILSADQSVIELLEREALDEQVIKAAYRTLAVLSTPASVDFLIEQVPRDQQVEAVLGRCTPAAAEQMLPALEGDNADLLLTVYRAVTKICKLRDVKADRFWTGHNLVIKRKEIERVRSLVTKRAQYWRKRYAEYR